MRNLVFKNLGLKIVAVLFSIGLWFIATHRGLAVIVLDVPLEFKNIPAGLVLVNHDIKKVSLSIKGQDRLIRNVNPTDIRAYIDLSEAKKGKVFYPISKNNLRMPRWVTVTNIDPSMVKVVMEELTAKTVPVKPVIIGNPEKGFYIKSINTMPKTVVIEGKSSDMKRVKSVKTEPIDITGFKKTFTQDIRLDIEDENIKAGAEDVEVRVVIEKRGR